MSQVFTTPAESLEIAIPLFTCRPTDLIEAKTGGVGTKSVVTGSADEVLICQNLIDPSQDDEIREEKNIREVMCWVCPMNVSTRWGSELVMFQILIV